jgi:hypothetical protein
MVDPIDNRPLRPSRQMVFLGGLGSPFHNPHEPGRREREPSLTGEDEGRGLTLRPEPRNITLEQMSGRAISGTADAEDGGAELDLIPAAPTVRKLAARSGRQSRSWWRPDARAVKLSHSEEAARAPELLSARRSPHAPSNRWLARPTGRLTNTRGYGLCQCCLGANWPLPAAARILPLS